jgi:putative ABC transporter-associated repeat protein
MSAQRLAHRRKLLIPLVASAAALGSAGVADAKVTLADGHADVGAARIVNGKLRSYVKDDTGSRPVWRDPSTVVIRVGNRARVRLPSGMGFVGRAGQRVWMIPQVQKRGVIWAGWNTEEISSRQIRGGVAWQLRSVSGPGRVVVFQTGSFGSEDVLFNSGRGMPQTHTIPVGTHAHGNWAFTRQGTYKMRFSMSVRTRSGQRRRDNATLTFRVG